jgi:hypothetical protein
MDSYKMIKKNEIIQLFTKNLWTKLVIYSPNEISSTLSFKDGLRIAYRLLYNDDWNEDFQHYAVDLLYALRYAHADDWNISWEYDAFLGLACDITYKHDERYEAYKKAFDKCNSPPPRLLVEFARCCVCPGPPPISYDQAINLVMEAMKNQYYSDGISLLCVIYSLKGDKKQEGFWSNTLKKLPKNANSPSIEPKFLVEEFFGKK